MRFKIGDICDINKSSLKKNHNLDFINYLDTGNITEGRVDEIKKIVLAEEKIPSRAKRIVKENDIIISTVRPNQKHYGIIKNPIENLIVSTGFVVLSPKKEVNTDYLYNYLTLPNITEYLQGIAETSTTAYPSITPSVISDLEIELPSLVEQKAIADILSSLDEKIELNNQMNETLEEMAQALFKRWFVDFEFPNEEGQPYKSSGGEMVESELGMIPKGWNIEQIGKISEIQNGFAFRADEYVGQGIPVLRTLNIKDGIFENTNIVFLPEEYKDSKYRKYIFEKFDCALVMVGAGIGKIGLILDNTKGGLQNQNMWRFRSLNNAIPQLYLNFLVKQARDKSKNWGNGSAREFYRKDSFSKINVLVANYTLLKQFNELILPLYNKISENVVENEVLIQLRDTLLPKLMSGEIRVSDLDTE